jgi:hypothetical protein
MTTRPNSNSIVVQSPSEWFAGVADVLGRQRLRWARAGALAANEYRLAALLGRDLSRDDEYIWHWAQQWQVTDRWDAARRGDFGD